MTFRTRSARHRLDPSPGRFSTRTTRLALTAIAVGAVVLGPMAAFAVGSPTTLISDGFDRVVTDGWGTAPTGTVYSVSSGQRHEVAVDGRDATMALTAGRSGTINFRSASAADVRAEVSLDLTERGGAAYYALRLRSQSDGSSYQGRMYVDARGVPHLGVNRISRGVETRLTSVRLGTSPIVLGSWYRLAFTVTGENPVRIEASLTRGSAASSTPQLVYADTAPSRIATSGGMGFWGYASAASVTTTRLLLNDLLVQDGVASLSASGQDGLPVPTASPSPAPTPTAKPAPSSPPTGSTQGGSTQGGSTVSAPTTTAPTNPGSVPVGSTDYPVPSNAIYASADALSSGDGTAVSPYASVQDAVNAAPPGSTVVLRGGIYHQSVVIPDGKALTVQSYPHEAVWFDGSVPLANWVRSGGVWISTGWTPQFSSALVGDASSWLAPGHPAANLPDQLFVDGTPLQQVTSASSVVAGTFAVDYAHQELILGSDPTGHSVSASDLSQAIFSSASGTVLQGFGVRRYATTYDEMATVRLQNTNSVARDLVIEDNAMTGLALSNDNDLAERVSVLDNGQLGIRATHAYGLVIRDSVVRGNNAEYFATAPESGGVKITRARGVTIEANDISDNHSTGLWFDQSCFGITVVRNTIDDNGGDIGSANLELELSASAVVAGNHLSGGSTGLYVVDSGDLRVFSNNLSDNSFMSIRMIQDARRQADPSTGISSDRDSRRPAVDSTVPWITQNITISDNVVGAGGQFSIYALDKATRRAVDSWNLVISGNVFGEAAGGGSQMIAWGLGDNASLVKYLSPAALQSAKGWSNVSVPAGLAPTGLAPTDVVTSSDVAVPLPADIAALLGTAPSAHLVGVP